MPKMQSSTSFLLLLICHSILSGCSNGHTVTFHVSNNCLFHLWPATAPNTGHPVIADGGFFLPSGQTRRIQAPWTWTGRIWARTGCKFTSTTKKTACQTGDCQGLLTCNGTIGLPPVTLVEVALQSGNKPDFYDVSLVDGYNVPVSVASLPADPSCFIGGCKKSLDWLCPPELQVLDGGSETVVACKSACLAFDLDLYCCRNAYGKQENCKPNVYYKMFKKACPSYFSHPFDTPPPLLKCNSEEYIITFCPSKWSSSHSPLDCNVKKTQQPMERVASV